MARNKMFTVSPKTRANALKQAGESEQAKRQQIQFSRQILKQIEDNLQQVKRQAVKEDQRVIHLENEKIFEQRHLDQLRKIQPMSSRPSLFRRAALRRRKSL